MLFSLSSQSPSVHPCSGESSVHPITSITSRRCHAQHGVGFGFRVSGERVMAWEPCSDRMPGPVQGDARRPQQLCRRHIPADDKMSLHAGALTSLSPSGERSLLSVSQTSDGTLFCACSAVFVPEADRPHPELHKRPPHSPPGGWRRGRFIRTGRSPVCGAHLFSCFVSKQVAILALIFL